MGCARSWAFAQFVWVMSTIPRLSGFQVCLCGLMAAANRNSMKIVGPTSLLLSDRGARSLRLMCVERLLHEHESRSLQGRRFVSRGLDFRESIAGASPTAQVLDQDAALNEIVDISECSVT